jgi:hypothetical protein
MASLDKSLRNQLERTVKDARDVAEAGSRSALEQLGVGDSNPPTHLSEAERELRRKLRIHGRQLGDARDEKRGTQQIDRLIEEVAYEHWHRMLFARFLAENKLLMYPDPQETVAISLVECEDMAADEGARNGWELAARYAARMLPQIFRPDSPVFGVALPPETQQSLESFISVLPVSVFTASDSLGWVYQFWQARRKDQVNASEVKIGARELPAVTQLFTEDYMVDFLLDNTLGAWHAGKVIVANPKLAEAARTEEELRNAVALPGCPWEYLRFIKSEDGKWTLAAGVFDGWPKTTKELKCLDPCMGSGHFVVAMFERLLALRMVEERQDEAETVSAVIRENLFGLEIDPRCTQIAAFNLALAAWRRVGYCAMPPMNLACSGLAPNTSEEEWLKLAGGNEKLENGMSSLYQLFENAPVLGSLINPRSGQADLLEAGFHELQPLLEKALAQETKDDTAHEMAVTARGLAKAAEILASQFTLVATNVPYLKRGNQDEPLMSHCEKYFADSCACLSTTFIDRCIRFCISRGTFTGVVPQPWLFLQSYKYFRKQVLEDHEWNSLARLGHSSFETISGHVVDVVLLTLTAEGSNRLGHYVDCDQYQTAPDKAIALQSGELITFNQAMQLKHPESRVVFGEIESGDLISALASSVHGQGSFDDPSFVHNFWEMPKLLSGWVFQQTSSNSHEVDVGLENVFLWEDGEGRLSQLMSIKAESGYTTGKWRAGHSAWGKSGIAVSGMGKLYVNRYCGGSFDTNVAVIYPEREDVFLALWCYCRSPQFIENVRKIDRKPKVTPNTFAKVPFDLEHWQKVAVEKYPHGLPKPFSSNPTQWVFNGQPKDSDNPLHVAVARLCGYEWPRQTGSSFPDCPSLGPDVLKSLADRDGIVCIPPVRGEASASDRLLNLLAKSYGQSWFSDVLPKLIKEAGFEGKSLETWLRDGFFPQHCELFHQRPFIWHIWDGLRDGFSALVNYHKLDRKNLETLIYTYLGDWMTRQTQELANGVDGVQEKLAAAEQLKKRLEMILTGEAPYDIFVRWKPLQQQPIGWEPDLNDGVRMNIRPFLSVPDVKAKGAGILRVKPKIKWDKDRGKEPQRSKEEYPWFWSWDEKTADFAGGPEFNGERFNDCHYTLDFKRQAKAKAGKP